MKRFSKYILFFLFSIVIWSAILGVNYGVTEENDPLVTQSYVEMRLDQVKVYFEEKISELSSRIETLEKNSSSSSDNVFEPIELNVGDELIGSKGTQIILRTGKARAIASEQGGLPDVTEGKDIEDNINISKQHLLIIPRDDERGIRIISSNAFVMVKGEYKIQ